MLWNIHKKYVTIYILLDYIHRIKYCPSITKFTCQLSTHTTNYKFWNFVSSFLFYFIFTSIHFYRFIVSFMILCSYLLFITYIVWVNFLSIKFLLFFKQLKSSIFFLEPMWIICLISSFLSFKYIFLMIMMNNQNSILTIYYNLYI